MQLSKNFKLAEFSHSETAARKGIDNTIPSVYVPNIKALCEQVLQPLRDHFRQAIRVTSGYRCPALNRAVGGAANSQHLTGEAADIAPPLSPRGGIADLLRWFVWIMDNCEFDQLILERSSPLGGKEGGLGGPGALWIHVSFCQRKNRQQVIFN